jgi:hypothetical protein
MFRYSQRIDVRVKRCATRERAEHTRRQSVRDAELNREAFKLDDPMIHGEGLRNRA